MRLRGERLTAPELADLAALPLRRAAHRPLLARCWELRDNLIIYDVSYVALAEALEVTLLTGHRRLSKAAGLRCHIEVLQPAP
jgi:predicted nucleic acid-binding protein